MPSSVIASYKYNIETETLTINFVSGTVYDYLYVPLKIYQAMKKFTSKGSFFNKYIKDQYPFIKIS